MMRMQCILGMSCRFDVIQIALGIPLEPTGRLMKMLGIHRFIVEVHIMIDEPIFIDIPQRSHLITTEYENVVVVLDGYPEGLVETRGDSSPLDVLEIRTSIDLVF